MIRVRVRIRSTSDLVCVYFMDIRYIPLGHSDMTSFSAVHLYVVPCLESLTSVP